MEQVDRYKCTQPCSNCPYRTDAPAAHWHKSEFKKLLMVENSQDGNPLSPTYSCHKKNGSICIGWLMNQVKDGLPSIGLRLELSRYNVSREYINSLHSPAPLYEDVRAMINANFPQLLKKKK